jgi:hypothetical protein
MHRAVLLALASVAAVVAVATSSAASAPSYVITGDTSIAGFPRDGTMRRALALFGQPQIRDPHGWGGLECRLVWPVWGMTMMVRHPDPLHACGPMAKHKVSTITGPRWHTSAGLKIGDPVARLRQLYPKAWREKPGIWWLKTRYLAGLPFPGLEAKIVKGRVASFTVHGPRAGF